MEPLNTSPEAPELEDSPRTVAPIRPQDRHPSASGRRAAAAVVLAIALATGLVQQFGGDWWAGAPQTLTAGAAEAATTPDQAAVEDAITRGNSEQVQALTAGTPALMADTSTTQHLQELAQVNQDLSSSGVAGIALIKLEWGPVTVDGRTASATTFETWTTTLTDGSTLQSRDQNDYSLVQDNGTWKIASDTHPTAAETATTQPAPAPASASTSDLASSGNWAGYAATNGTYTAVTGTWSVPAFTATSSAGVSAAWVGIGGVGSRDLIQAGTQEATSGTGQTQYQAWIEMLPQASTSVPLSVSPGDSITVSIADQSQNNWLISFANNTTGKAYQQTVQYASSHSSAEWIQEAPSAARAGVLPLDDFGSVSFSNASTTKNGQSESISAAGATGISMIGATRQALAVPSSLSSDGASFSVSRTSNPATTQSTSPARGRRG